MSSCASASYSIFGLAIQYGAALSNTPVITCTRIFAASGSNETLTTSYSNTVFSIKSSLTWNSFTVVGKYNNDGDYSTDRMSVAGYKT